jgi:hypothetical protein
MRVLDSTSKQMTAGISAHAHTVSAETACSICHLFFAPISGFFLPLQDQDVQWAISRGTDELCIRYKRQKYHPLRRSRHRIFNIHCKSFTLTRRASLLQHTRCPSCIGSHYATAMGASHSTPPPLVEVNAPGGKVLVPPGKPPNPLPTPFMATISSLPTTFDTNQYPQAQHSLSTHLRTRARDQIRTHAVQSTRLVHHHVVAHAQDLDRILALEDQTLISWKAVKIARVFCLV